MKAVTVTIRIFIGTVVLGLLVVAAIIPGMTMGGDLKISELTVGSPAPPLAVTQWINGGPVTLGDDQHVYVIEFWTTYCPRCLITAPHLSELQNQYRGSGLIIAGVTPESAAGVQAFLDEKGKAITYRVALDPEWKTGERYMDAVDAGQLPYAFIIDRAGHIAWHGDPHEPDFDAEISKALRR